MPASPTAQLAYERDRQVLQNELALARYAAPAALVAFVLIVHTGLGQFVSRTFAGMWLHELGHAVAAWLSGLIAFPGPWCTPVAGERSGLFAFLIAAALGYLGWRGWTEERRSWTIVAASLLAVQLVCTLALPAASAHTFVTYSGEAGSLVFGAALVATFFTPPGHKLHRDWLRWGFLVIGAAAFADTFVQWWRARTDVDAAGLGQLDTGELTDPTKLLGLGWSLAGLTRQYLAIGVLSLAALAVLQYRHVRRTRDALDRLEWAWQRELRKPPRDDVRTA
jgi:hypothetical protein